MICCRKRNKLASVQEDVVILHQFTRARNTPSLSPFVLKLETYLRVADIPYEVDFDKPTGPKGKTPWITLNGKDTADSQLCIELLSRKFKKNLNSHLSDEELAVAKALQVMVDEHLYWVFVLWLWAFKKGLLIRELQSGLPDSFLFKFARPFVRRKLVGMAIKQGMGRHTESEVMEMGMKDLKALSDYLGNKPFFTGQKAAEVDCAIFGSVAMFLWNMPGSPYERAFSSDLSNLKDFCLRMKESYWPDWNLCLKPPRD